MLVVVVVAALQALLDLQVVQVVVGKAEEMVTETDNQVLQILAVVQVVNH
jgi:hypothetical protein